ncbi:MAG: hypothetical protein A2X78_01930 [Gammaproteobacteria bacterium GWE2_37_16]|nr:MAG: hypothetical protein A2X78_01930 [Gammaproteobacteria bacterium GWE2_37_16]
MMMVPRAVFDMADQASRGIQSEPISTPPIISAMVKGAVSGATFGAVAGARCLGGQGFFAGAAVGTLAGATTGAVEHIWNNSSEQTPAPGK